MCTIKSYICYLWIVQSSSNISAWNLFIVGRVTRSFYLQTSLNDTVDVLSLRVIQLENDLVEQQEIQEELEAERADLEQQVIKLELKCKGNTS